MRSISESKDDSDQEEIERERERKNAFMIRHSIRNLILRRKEKMKTERDIEKKKKERKDNKVYGLQSE